MQSGGLLVLLVITVLNVYKPRGLTPYGWRKQEESRAELMASSLAHNSTEQEGNGGWGPRNPDNRVAAALPCGEEM